LIIVVIVLLFLKINFYEEIIKNQNKEIT